MASLGRNWNSAGGCTTTRVAPRICDADADGLSAFRGQFGSSFEHNDFSDASIDRRENAQSLSTLIESEIIPRLMIAHGGAHAGGAARAASPGGSALILPGEVEALAPLALQIEADPLLVPCRGVSGARGRVRHGHGRSARPGRTSARRVLGRRPLRFRRRDDGSVAAAGGGPRDCLPGADRAAPCRGRTPCACSPRCPATSTVSAPS